MATAGFPGEFQGGFTTGNLSIGAVQKDITGSAGFPGAFQGGFTTGSLNVGAVQKAEAIAVTLIAERGPFRGINRGIGRGI